MSMLFGTHIPKSTVFTETKGKKIANERGEGEENETQPTQFGPLIRL